MEETTTEETTPPEVEFVPPASVEDAEARLEEIKFEKKELDLERKQINEEMRLMREEYSSASAKRSTRGKGVGAMISDDIGDASKKAASLQNSYGRKQLAVDLEPLEARRAEIEAERLALDAEKLELEKWIAAQERAEAEAPEPSEEELRVAAQLEGLEDMKERGVLTEEEYQAEKQRILAEEE